MVISAPVSKRQPSLIMQPAPIVSLRSACRAPAIEIPPQTTVSSPTATPASRNRRMRTRLNMYGGGSLLSHSASPSFGLNSPSSSPATWRARRTRRDARSVLDVEPRLTVHTVFEAGARTPHEALEVVDVL